MREADDELGHIPEVYRSDKIHCDCWFMLWDISRLVSDDTLAVVDELKKLRNTAYHDMPVSTLWRNGESSADRYTARWRALLRA